jgi:predicted RNA-binding protein with PUA-like domain
MLANLLETNETPRKRRGAAKATSEVTAKEPKVTPSNGTLTFDLRTICLICESEDTQSAAPKRGRGRKSAKVTEEGGADETRESPSAQLEKEFQDNIDSTLEDKEEAPQPRKRGRPAKVAGPSGEAKVEKTAKTRGRPPRVAAKDAAPADDEDAAPKRKRGRPSASAIKEEAAAAEEAPAKKGRGRPPKATKNDDTSPNDEAPAKRGRGRPPKSAAKDAADDEDDAPKKKRGRPAATAVKDQVSADDEDAPVKRGRGRPKKSAAHDDASADDKAPVRRGRGRPPKPAAGEAKKKRGRPAKTENDDGEAPAKKKRGRPSKVDAQDDDNQMPDTPSAKRGPPSLKDAQAEETPRRRGRPSIADAEASTSGRKTSARTSLPASLKPGKERGRPSLASRAAGATPVSHGKRGRPPKRRASTDAEDLETAPQPKRKRNESPEKATGSGDAERLTPDLADAPPEPPKTEPPKLAAKGGAKRRKRQSSPGPAQPRAKRVKIDDLTQPLGGPEDGPQYWLFKAEPESRIVLGKDVKFSIDDLMNADSPEPWSGVRNHAAKNHMRAMKKGDLGFFYHSSCKVPGVVGILEVAKEATVDETAFDETDPYYDEKSDRDNPRWMCVSVVFRQKFDKPNLTTLTELKKHSANDEGTGALKDMMLFRQGRLSVGKVAKKEWNFILNLAGHLEHLAGEGETEEKEAQAGAEEYSVKDSQDGAGDGFAERLEKMIESVDQAVEDIMQGVDHTAEDTILDQTVEETILDVDQTADDIVQDVMEAVAEQIVEELNGHDENGFEIARKLP